MQRGVDWFAKPPAGPLHRGPALGGWHLPGGRHGALVGVGDRGNQSQHAAILRDSKPPRQGAKRW